MKKLIYLLSITFLILQSCSSDENGNSDSNETNVVLVKKIVNSIDGEINLSYNGTKLTKMTFTGGGYVNITYSGDLIDKMEWFSSNNVSEQRNEYSYSSNKLTQFKLYSSNNKLEEISNLTYNSDGSITELISIYNGKTLPSSTISYKKYFDSVGNIIKQEQFSNNVVIATRFYTYDKKNSPFKNVTGINIVGISGLGFFSKNNILSEEISSTSSPQMTKDVANTYQYNSQDFPISKTSTSYGQTSTETYFY